MRNNRRPVIGISIFPAIVLLTVSVIYAGEIPLIQNKPPLTTQGGDNIQTAFPITALPFSDTGTTIGYIDDYNGPCGSGGGSAPDVVYSFEPHYTGVINIDLCYSSNFDTRLYIFDGDESHVIACNDDYCSNQYSDYLSAIVCLEFEADHTYYIVIDGYGVASGNFSIDFGESLPGAMIFGTVQTAGGAPLGGAAIRILQDSTPVWQDTSYENGEYFVWGLAEGSYFVEASKIGYITQQSGPYLILDCFSVQVDFTLQTERCQISPPLDAIIEDESICYDDFEDFFNSGCPTGVWDTITANCEFYGTSGDYNYNDATLRDEDWLEVDIDGINLTYWEVYSEFETEFTIIRQGPDNPCEGYEEVRIDTVPACDSTQISDLLWTGKYWIRIRPNSFSGIPCGSGYYFSLYTYGYNNCCYINGDVNGSGRFDGLDIVFGVNYFKGGMPPPYYCICNGYYWHESGDINGDCHFNGLDITYMVGVLKGFWPASFCPECPSLCE